MFSPSTAFRGMRDDVRNRAKVYRSDWTDAATVKVLSSTLFIFFTSFGPAITFSLLLSESTKNEVGAIEVLLATSITGILFAIFAGQPLVIVGVTGPVSILTITIYTLAEQLGIRFIPFYGWSQLWGGFMLILLAILNACDSLKLVTRFSCEIFGVLIALVYLYTGINGISLVLGNMRTSFDGALLQFIIAIGTLYTAQVLSHAKTWHILSDTARSTISDYGATVAIIMWSFVPAVTNYRLEDGSIPTLFVPLTFETSNGRPWFVDFTDIPVWGIFAASVPGAIIAVLFFFDHNVSSLLAQEADLKLKKASAFHLDFFVVGLSLVLTGLLGIPPTNGLIPQAPLHVKSLQEKRRIYIHDKPTEEYEVVGVHEQRVSNFLQSLLCGLVCFRPFSDVLREIPKAVLYGLFLFLGLSSFEDNEFAYRLGLLVMDPALRKMRVHPYEFVLHLKFASVCKFTLIQAVLCAAIFGITFTPAAVVFPVLIALLVWLRIYLLPKLFTALELRLLDSFILKEAAAEGSRDGSDTDQVVEVGVMTCSEDEPTPGEEANLA